MSKDRKEEVKKLVNELEEGVTKIFETDFVKYLDFLSRFHNYSFGNTVLIMMQKPDASLCAGYKSWEKMGRNVKRGESAIKILAPMIVKAEVEKEEIDETTGEVKRDQEGKTVTKKEQVQYRRFRVVNVFDLSQTEGDEIPSIGIDELTGEVDRYDEFIDAITDLVDVPVTYENIDSGAKGFYDQAGKRIVINDDMSELQTLKTLVHEAMHRFLHDKEGCQIDTVEREKSITRNQKEVEAEASAYVVLKHFGIDTSDYSFGYVCGWAAGKNMSTLKDALGTIVQASDWMIEKIEKMMTFEEDVCMQIG